MLKWVKIFDSPLLFCRPLFLARGNETTLTLMASKQGPVMATATAGTGDESGFTIPTDVNEILAVLSDPIEGITSMCQRALQIIEDNSVREITEGDHGDELDEDKA